MLEISATSRLVSYLLADKSLGCAQYMISKSNVKSVSCDDVRIFHYLFQNNVSKTLLDFFVIAGIIKVSASVISLGLPLG